MFFLAYWPPAEDCGFHLSRCSLKVFPQLCLVFSLVRGERELLLHSSGQDYSGVNYLPLVAGDDSLWRLRCIQDTQSPWWSFPPQWAGWLPTGREGTTTAWRSFPGSPRARLRRPGSHSPPAAGRHRNFSLKTHFNTYSSFQFEDKIIAGKKSSIFWNFIPPVS